MSTFMSNLRFVSSAIDALNRFMGKIACVGILLATLISAGNAISRHLFKLTSNGLLESQWYLFASVFLLASGYTYLCNQHVRIDVISSKLSTRTRSFIEIIGILLFLLPAFSVIFYVSLTPAIESWRIWEMSANPGGLARAPIKMMIPIGISLLLLQGISQLCKQILFLNGHMPELYTNIGMDSLSHVDHLPVESDANTPKNI